MYIYFICVQYKKEVFVCARRPEPIWGLCKRAAGKRVNTVFFLYSSGLGKQLARRDAPFLCCIYKREQRDVNDGQKVWGAGEIRRHSQPFDDFASRIVCNCKHIVVLVC